MAVAYIKSRAAYNGSVAATKVRALNDNKSRPNAGGCTVKEHSAFRLESQMTNVALNVIAAGTGVSLFTAILGILMVFGCALIRTKATYIMAYSGFVGCPFGTGDSAAV